MLGACNNIPFKKTELVAIDIKCPGKIVSDHNRQQPEKFTVLNSIVFHYYWKTFSGLGVCKADIKQNEVTVVGMTQMGIKLFEISEHGGLIKYDYAVEEFRKHRKFPETLIRDIHKMYFNKITDNNRKITKTKYKIFCSVPHKNGELHYIFGGEKLYLLEKKYIKNNEAMWKVSFYNYILRNGRRYPKGIVLNNKKDDYSLIIKLKEIIH